MIDNLLTKIKDAFNLNLKEFIFVLLLIVLVFFSVNTNQIVKSMDQRYFDDVYENAAAVLTVLQKNNVYEPNDILAFLEIKPAGKSNLKKGVMTDQVYTILVSQYDGLAKNARIAFQ